MCTHFLGPLIFFDVLFFLPRHTGCDVSSPLRLTLRLGNQCTAPYRRVNVFDVSSFFSYPLIFARLSPPLSFLPRAVTYAIGGRQMTVQGQGTDVAVVG